jgi:hypothetical protein
MIYRFEEKPDVLGWGRIVVDGQYFALPSRAVALIATLMHEVYALRQERDELQGRLRERIQD